METRPFFFVHLMKTAGSTFRWTLHSNFADEEIFPRPGTALGGDVHRVDEFTGLSAEQRAGIRVFSGHVPFVTPELMGGGFTTITILREPVARTVSFLKQCRALGEGLADQPFEAIYEHPLRFAGFIRDHQAKVLSLTAADRFDSVMTNVVVDDARLAIALDNLERADVLGVTERFDLLLDEVERRFGWRRFVGPDQRVQGEVPVSPSLLRRIERDTAADAELHRRALELVARRARVVVPPLQVGAPGEKTPPGGDEPA